MSDIVRRMVLIAAMCVFAVTAPAAQRAQHVFIICIDGGKPSVIQQSDMPVLKKLVAEGACTWKARTVFPSWTLPVITSTLTGVTQEKHKITWNNFAPERGIVAVPTVFSEAKKAGLSTAMFVGKEKFRHLDDPGTLDKFDYDPVDFTDITKSMPGETKPRKESTVLAWAVARDAARYITARKPSLCFVHLTDPDNTGHNHGWGSPAQIKSFADVDAALGIILRAVNDAGIADECVVIITADHGGHAKTHGLSIPEDMNIPWIAWGKGVKKGIEIAAPVSTCDTAVTTFWLLDVPCPGSLDGKLVSGAFE